MDKPLNFSQRLMTVSEVKAELALWNYPIPEDSALEKPIVVCGLGSYDTRSKIMSYWISTDTEGRA